MRNHVYKEDQQHLIDIFDIQVISDHTCNFSVAKTVEISGGVFKALR